MKKLLLLAILALSFMSFAQHSDVRSIYYNPNIDSLCNNPHDYLIDMYKAKFNDVQRAAELENSDMISDAERNRRQNKRYKQVDIVGRFWDEIADNPSRINQIIDACENGTDSEVRELVTL